MRRIPILLLTAALAFTGAAFGQAMTEFAAAATGGSVGAAGGKSLSNGINSIFGKVGKQLDSATKSDKPALTVAPGVVKEGAAKDGGVPAPAPLVAPVSRTPVRREPSPAQAAVEIPFTIGNLADALPAQAPPPPPTMSPDDLKKVENGMSRAELLRFGAPASKITMYDGGHVVESYSYRGGGQRLGGVKLTDGVVSSVEAQ